MGNKPCKMCSIAWDIRGETRACMRLKNVYYTWVCKFTHGET